MLDPHMPLFLGLLSLGTISALTSIVALTGGWGKKIPFMAFTYVGLLGAAALLIASILIPSDWVAVSESGVFSTRQILSLDDTSRLEGDFFLGSGTVSNTDYYVTYQVRDDGGKTRVRFDASETVVFETQPAGQAFVEDHGVVVTCKDDLGLLGLLFQCRDGFSHREYQLHVPENTITREIVLDNE